MGSPLQHQATGSILVVDDDDTARELIASILARIYPTLVVHSAKNGLSASELFKLHTPDIVITDIWMPIKNGIELAEEIQHLRSDILIIITSGSSTDTIAPHLSGIDGYSYLAKPLDMQSLFELIDSKLCAQALSAPTTPHHPYP